MSEWMTLVKKEMAKGLSLKDAMKAAKKHYHPSKKTQKGGVLVKVGGKRRRSTRKHRGGALYGFGEGGGSLHGGLGRMTPVGSVADSAPKGGRRRSRRHH